MKVAELSARSAVSIPTIKYYVREGLLPAGKQTATNQASYDDDHVRRLRLIRALIDVGDLQISEARAALAAVDDESASLHDAFGAVMHGLDTPAANAPPDDVAAAETEVGQWLEARGWAVTPDAPARRRLAEAVATMHRFGMPVAVTDFDGFADATERTAHLEVGYARSKADRTAAVETMLIGTVVLERARAEIRRLALEAVSAELGDER